MNNIKKISIITLLTLTLTPLFSFAQTQLEKPTGPGADRALVQCDTCGAKDAVNIIQNIMNLAFMFSGFVVAVMFMYAGFLLITAVGDTGKIQKARNIFKRTVIGFIVMYLSYILVLNVLKNIGALPFFNDIIK